MRLRGLAAPLYPAVCVVVLRHLERTPGRPTQPEPSPAVSPGLGPPCSAEQMRTGWLSFLPVGGLRRAAVPRTRSADQMGFWGC